MTQENVLLQIKHNISRFMITMYINTYTMHTLPLQQGKPRVFIYRTTTHTYISIQITLPTIK